MCQELNISIPEKENRQDKKGFMHDNISSSVVHTDGACTEVDSLLRSNGFVDFVGLGYAGTGCKRTQ